MAAAPEPELSVTTIPFAVAAAMSTCPDMLPPSAISSSLGSRLMSPAVKRVRSRVPTTISKGASRLASASSSASVSRKACASTRPVSFSQAAVPLARPPQSSMMATRFMVWALLGRRRCSPATATPSSTATAARGPAR
jgi:hypothetical protein